MNNQDTSAPNVVPDVAGTETATVPPPSSPPSSSSSAQTPSGNGNERATLTPFWRDRLFEVGLILAMLLYYIVGNAKLPILDIMPLDKSLPNVLLNEFLSLPFLLLFAVLCWYRLPVAIALLPLSLPFYAIQKVVIANAAFSLAEITLATCLVVAVLHLLFNNRDKLAWPEWRERIGPFVWPILLFCLVAAFAIIGAYSRNAAIRSFHEEILAPLLYLGLALAYLRTRQDVLRLFAALVGTGVLIALFGLAQYLIFKNTLHLEDGVRRIAAVYGSANSVGLLFDYVLPIGLALLVARGVSARIRWLALAACLLMLPVLYLTDSGGAWAATVVAVVFIVACSFGNRKVVLIGGLVTVVSIAVVLVLFHTRIYDYVVTRHMNAQGQSSALKRIYLWESAWAMIQHSPWLGYGMDNWLCHYSLNNECHSTVFHYWILIDPSGKATGLQGEPDLSHPHNIFLHVWVSIGIFGLLAFVAVLALFYRLFARILSHLYASSSVEGYVQLRWMTIGVGASMLAALVQGMVDSAFLEQDLAFCFWMLVTALLLLRVQAGVSWKRVNVK